MKDIDIMRQFNENPPRALINAKAAAAQKRYSLHQHDSEQELAGRAGPGGRWSA
ncbi:hypothetical protein [Martelella sp. HB161492]|uniref:hypothetical protein n=1 Tax=Martelella sp. HB161492 TaxID=2720726 RepID=UPI0015910510|nr:hypothetical protein [Martelella sp. HB161492]